MNVEKWLKENTHSLVGKRVAVTGSTGGIGAELCDLLASLGASLVLLDRNAIRSEEHKHKLMNKYCVEVSCCTLDLEDIISAEKAAVFLTEKSIDVFIHNAGAYAIPRHKTTAGYDNVFQINFASPYYLIHRILPSLRERRGRVVVVGSIAHNYSRIDPADVDFSTRSAASLVYGNSKRYLMYGLYDLFREERSVTLSVTHPGITFTNITAHYPKLVFVIIKHPMKIIFMRPGIAALSILRGVFKTTEPDTWIGPWLFNVWGRPKKQRLTTSSQTEKDMIASISRQVFDKCKNTVQGENI